VAALVVRTHGFQLFVEEGPVSAWARTWGRSVAAFTPGLLVSAIDREAQAVAGVDEASGGVVRIPTRTTALSQHCPCGARVPKTLADRVHRCPRCGLEGDRDAVSAVLASFVVLDLPGETDSARVDYTAAKRARPEVQRLLTPYLPLGWQDTRSESNDLFAREASCPAWRTSTPASSPVARRTAGTATGPNRNEPPSREATSERARWRTGLPHDSTVQLWDSS
jgi:hypothetical protein